MEKALLKCGGNHEMVAVNNHTYTVVDGYVLIDVRPFLRAPRLVENTDIYGEMKWVPNPLHDPMADAEADATEICRIVSIEEDFGVARRFRVYEPPSKRERDAWLADPAHLAAWEGISLEEAEKRLAPALVVESAQVADDKSKKTPVAVKAE